MGIFLIHFNADLWSALGIVFPEVIILQEKTMSLSEPLVLIKCTGIKQLSTVPCLIFSMYGALVAKMDPTLAT